MRHYCTLFDGGYVARGLALAESLNRHCSPCRTYILCMDNDAEVLLDRLKIPNVILIRLTEFEKEDVQLADVKPTRSVVEYYFTSKACLMRYVFAKNPDCERVTYLDADLFFFSDPSELDREIAEMSVAIIEHRFSPGNQRLYKFGRFNAGWFSVRNDSTGRQCIEWWRRHCLEWCYDFVEGDRYADQRYMDKMPALFGAAIVSHIGANLAPWNIGNYTLTHVDGKIFVDGRPVIFFHFQGVKRLFGPFVETGLASYRQQLTSVARFALFAPYLETWREAERKVVHVSQELASREVNSQPGVFPKKIKRGSLIRRSRILLMSILLSIKYRTLCLSSADAGRKC